MKRSIKTTVFFLLSLTILAGLISCSNGEAEVQEEADGEQVTLKFIWWGSESRKESTLKVIELYTQQNPHVTFETEVVSNTAEIATQLAIHTANQTTPDIIQADYNFIYNYINRDLVEPLNPFSDKKILNLADIDTAYLAPGIKDEKLYALPIANNSPAFIYNPKLFEQTGVPALQEDYTIDELYQTMVALKEKIDSPDFYPLGNMFDVFYYMRINGVSLYNSDGTGLGYEDDQILADYYALIKKWRAEGLLGSSSTSNAKNDETHPLVTGKTAFYSVSSNTINTLSKVSGQALKLLPYPRLEGGQEGKFIKPSMFLAMSSYSKHKEEAAKFIDFFINDEAANDILNGERGVPVSNKIAARLSEKLDASGKEQYLFLDYLKTNSAPLDPPYPSNHVVMNQAYDMALKAVTDGSMTPEQGAKQYREQAKQYLNGEGEVSGQ